jgi:hypothetical protein
MEPTARQRIRKSVSLAAATMSGITIIPIAGQFFIQVATDKHWYDNAGSKWDRIVSAAYSFVTSTPFLCCVFALLGLTAGLWIDSLLAKRERKSDPSGLEARQILATQARDVSSQIFAIYGQYSGRSSAEWRQNTNFRGDPSEAWAKENVSESMALETYNRDCAAKA